MVNGSGRFFSLEDTRILKGQPVERWFFLGKFRMQKFSCAAQKAWNKDMTYVSSVPFKFPAQKLSELWVLHHFSCSAQAQSVDSITPLSSHKSAFLQGDRYWGVNIKEQIREMLRIVSCHSLGLKLCCFLAVWGRSFFLFIVCELGSTLDWLYISLFFCFGKESILLQKYSVKIQERGGFPSLQLWAFSFY